MLVVSEVALALVLLIGAGLALRSVYYLMHAGLQVDPAKVLVFEVSLPDIHYPAESPQRTQFFEQLLARVQALPGVEAAGTAMFTPFASRAQIPVALKGHPEEPGKPARWAGMNSVSPDFFKALGLPVRQGRGFTAEDRKGAPEVVVINETMARRYWPGENPIGQQLGGGSNDTGITVVGVVRDLRAGGVEASGTPDFYRCSYQSPWFNAVLVRTTGDPMKLVPQVQSLMRSLDKRVPVESVQTLDHLLSGEAADARQLGELLTFFAGLALTLAVVGIYGVIAYTAAQRTHEFGLRMALGAQKSDVAILVLTWGSRLALGGAMLGLVLAWGLTRLMASLLEGISPTDPATFAAMPLVIAAVALLACWLPARRATKTDPMTALRYE
jgi:predicted permease